MTALSKDVFWDELYSAHAPGKPLNQERKRLLESSPFFDAEWYASVYPDVAQSGLDSLSHYLWLGYRLGRDPGPKFDAQWYLRRNPLVLKHGLDPLFHYLKWGRNEGRKIRSPGQRSPYYSDRFGLRYVDRRVAAWDAERESEFKDEVSRRYIARSSRYDHVSVSIVMPTFNRAHCIVDAIESVIAQTHTNWKLIISDDGSDDDTAIRVSEIKDSRVLFLKGQRGGVSVARNSALAKCDGDYVFYLDTDNKWRPDFLRTMLVFMVSQGLDAAYSAAECSVGQGVGDYIRGDDFEWSACLRSNYVDMNCFGHVRRLVSEYGGFDQSLRRLVDWDLILRYTKSQRTAFAPFVGVHYDDSPKGDRITLSEYSSKSHLEEVMERIRAKHAGVDLSETRAEAIRPMAEDLPWRALGGASIVEAAIETVPAQEDCPPVRVGYVLWDWPALSQTFVLTEIRSLCERGYDVKVYYRVTADQVANVGFAVDAYQINDEAQLAELCEQHQRTCLHSPFVYPAGTLLTWPVAEKLKIPFTLMAGGVDVAHYENMKRNHVGEMTASPLCLGVITLGSFHRDLLLDCGVPSSKLMLERQSVDLPIALKGGSELRPRRRILCVARFIEKKGVEYLIRAAQQLPDADFVLHGYGPLQARYEKLIDDLRLDNFHLMAPLSSKDQLIGAYLEADVFALPCVRAANGDLDGLPTVLLEAMAVGLPVVTSRIANTPDLVVDNVTGYLCDPENVDSLVAALKRSLDADERGRRSMSEIAKRRAVGYAKAGRTIDTLLSQWQRRSVDIFLVTFDVPGYENVEDTIEIIRRVYEYTSLDFQLYVADNASTAEFKASLRAEFGDRPNFHLIELAENMFCGPASNVAVSKGQSEYAIYLCSKEGFVLRHGWEHRMVQAMDAEPEAAMGGYLVGLAKYPTVGSLSEYPSFKEWRNQAFASSHCDVPFKHVQGGVFILRRSDFETHGGFSSEVVHNGMDIEYSYFLQSEGRKLIGISGVAAVTVKTLPPLRSLLDEHTLVVHPSSKEESPILDGIVLKQMRHCNLCGWHGVVFHLMAGGAELCPDCGSRGFDRTAYRVLSQSGFLQGRPHVTAAVASSALPTAMKKVCPRQRLLALGDVEDLHVLVESAQAGGLVIADHRDWKDVQIHRIVDAIVALVASGGAVLLGTLDEAAFKEMMSAVCGKGVIGKRLVLLSDVSRFDTQPVYFFSGTELPSDLQGIDG